MARQYDENTMKTLNSSVEVLISKISKDICMVKCSYPWNHVSQLFINVLSKPLPLRTECGIGNRCIFLYNRLLPCKILNFVNRYFLQFEIYSLTLFRYYKHSCCIFVSSFPICEVVVTPFYILVFTGYRKTH